MDEFEDLDEIIARYIQPMAAFARDITNYKYYVDSEGGKRDIMEKIVQEEKRKANSRSDDRFSTFIPLLYSSPDFLLLAKHLKTVPLFKFEPSYAIQGSIGLHMQ